MKIRYRKSSVCCEGRDEMPQASSCCQPAQPVQPVKTAQEKKAACCAGAEERSTIQVRTVATGLSPRDRLRHALCRLGSYRMAYKVAPGLYGVGSPSHDALVFVSANYGLSFDMLRSSLAGMDAWILVLDTKGINVWCAAGKGTFGTDELVRQIEASGLSKIVTDRKVIVPQLGAPGVSAHEVKKRTGFKVVYGPVRATDIRAFINSGLTATEEMRRVEFSLRDRFVLTPMEIRPALRHYAIFSLICILILSITPDGVSLARGLKEGKDLIILAGAGMLSGALITPLLLPFIPARSFALKGLITGFAVTATLLWLTGWFEAMHPLLKGFSMVLFPLASSYLALQFTGSSTYTGISGVKKELSYAMPVYISGVVVSALLIFSYKIAEWGLS